MKTNLPLDESTRDRLIQAAGKVFASKGFDQGTVREICRLAKANINAVNYYFRDKQSLYIEAVKEADRWRLERATLLTWAPDTSPEQKLYDFISTQLTRALAIQPDQWQAQLLMRELFEPTAACEHFVSQGIRPQFELLQQILTELVGQPIAPERLKAVVFSIVGQWMFYRFAKPVVQILTGSEVGQGHSIDAIARHITGFTLAALGKTSIDWSAAP